MIRLGSFLRLWCRWGIGVSVENLVCITVVSRGRESPAEFSTRLTQFWTLMLRETEADFEKIFAESTQFETMGEKLGRQYLVETDVVAVLEIRLKSAGFTFEPVDSDELYSKYEASPPDWMQIEH